MIQSYFLPCLIGISACFIATTTAYEAIIGGDKVVDGKFTYQVSIQIHAQGKIRYCGGGVIGDYFILTAAHCVLKTDFTDNMLVIAGTNNRKNVSSPQAMKVKVNKIFWPKGYELTIKSSLGDIAVLKIQDPLHKNVQKLKLPQDKHETYTGKTAEITGFGWNSIDVTGNTINGGKSDNLLRHAEAVVHDHCKQGKDIVTIPKEFLCAQVKQRFLSRARGVCVGDSGGPLVYDETVIGVLSMGPHGCSEKMYATLYTRVSQYEKFIQNAMENRKSEDINTRDILHDN